MRETEWVHQWLFSVHVYLFLKSFVLGQTESPDGSVVRKIEKNRWPKYIFISVFQFINHWFCFWNVFQVKAVLRSLFSSYLPFLTYSSHFLCIRYFFRLGFIVPSAIPRVSWESTFHSLVKLLSATTKVLFHFTKFPININHYYPHNHIHM